MDIKIITSVPAKPGFASQCMTFMLLMLCLLTASAQEADQACQFSLIDQAFRQYVQTVDRTQIVRIQTLLNSGGYGTLKTDGILGASTRRALQRFCQDSQVTSPDNIANVLVELLEKNAADQPRPLPQPDKQPVQSQPLTDPTIFYRWQPADAEEGDKQTAAAVTTADQEALQADSENAIPDDVLTQLGQIEGVAYPNALLFEKALAHIFADTKINYTKHQDQILQQARTGPETDLNKIQLNGGECGCSRDLASLVYGFYPYWLASPDAEQIVDFSIFDRIGFYALSLNQEGNIQNPLQWSNSWDAAGFINKAHKYRVDVDLTIQASDWQNWTDVVIDNAVKNVAKAVTQEFTKTDPNSLREIVPLLEDTSSVKADGVTIMFDHYMGSKADANIITFMTQLAKQLRDSNSNARLNLMLDLDVDKIEKQHLFSNLAPILLDEEDSTVNIDHVFVFLQEPTTDAKKILRRAIEDDFRGVDRKTVLRKIVPVLTPHGHDKDPRGAFVQFTDDLIYLQDNFAGVGFWPLPLDSDAGADTLKAKIIELYTAPNGANHLGDMIDEYAPALCQFACPNRWLFRLGFDLLAGALLVYALMAVWICRLRSVYKQNFIYFLAFIAATMIVFLISLVCDPYWKDKADIVVILVVLAVAVYMLWKYVSRVTRPPLP